MKDGWKSTTTAPGEQSVMTTSTKLTPQLLAGVYMDLGKFTVFHYIYETIEKMIISIDHRP